MREQERLAERQQRLRRAAEEFAHKASAVPSVDEVVLAGSMATDDPYPNDVDVAIVIHDLADLPQIARAARQMSSHYHGWEVFVFAPDRTYLGRLCHKRECPDPRGYCEAPDCGQVPHIGNMVGFRFDPSRFLVPLLEPLWVRSGRSALLAWREELGLPPPPSRARRAIRLDCVDCGRRFTFPVDEQKIFEKRGFTQPKRCPSCRQRRSGW